MLHEPQWIANEGARYPDQIPETYDLQDPIVFRDCWSPEGAKNMLAEQSQKEQNTHKRHQKPSDRNTIGMKRFVPALTARRSSEHSRHDILQSRIEWIYESNNALTDSNNSDYGIAQKKAPQKQYRALIQELHDKGRSQPETIAQDLL